MRSSCGRLLLAFGEAGLAWAEALAARAGAPLAELGAVVLGPGLLDPRSPAAIAARPEPALIQLSADARVAFTEAASRLDGDEDEDGDF